MTISAVPKRVLPLLLLIVVGYSQSAASKEGIRQAGVPRALATSSGGEHFPDEAEAFVPLEQQHAEESGYHFSERQHYAATSPLEASMVYGTTRYGQGLLQAARA